MTLSATWFQTNVSPLVNARDERRRFRAMVQSVPAGQSFVYKAQDFAVSPVGAGTTLQVQVGACQAGGGAVIYGQDAAQGAYFVYNDALLTLPVAIADASNPRIDTVILRIFDDEITPGSGFSVSATVIAGAPAASPAPPALPRDSIAIADVRVNAAVTGIVAGNITDRRGLASTLIRPWGVAWGNIANVALLANVSLAAIADVAVLQVPFNPLAGRRYVASLSGGWIWLANGTSAIGWITDGTPTQLAGFQYTGVAGQASAFSCRTPMLTAAVPGNILKVRAQGSGSDVRLAGSADRPITLFLDDVGPVPGSTPP
jgi:hypothetical protein